MFYQQGDVLLEVVNEVKGKQNQKHNGIVAYGEATGHKHKFSDLTGLDFYEEGETLYLNVREKSTITHEEHKEIELPVGKYRVSIVREYDPFEDEIRAVRD